MMKKVNNCQAAKVQPRDISRSSHQRCSVKKGVQNSQKNPCARVSFLIMLQALACNFIKKETQAQGFSCEFCEISKKTFFIEHLWTTASVLLRFCLVFRQFHPGVAYKSVAYKKECI